MVPGSGSPAPVPRGLAHPRGPAAARAGSPRAGWEYGAPWGGGYAVSQGSGSPGGRAVPGEGGGWPSRSSDHTRLKSLKKYLLIC